MSFSCRFCRRCNLPTVTARLWLDSLLQLVSVDFETRACQSAAAYLRRVKASPETVADFASRPVESAQIGTTGLRMFLHASYLHSRFFINRWARVCCISYRILLYLTVPRQTFFWVPSCEGRISVYPINRALRKATVLCTQFRKITCELKFSSTVRTLSCQ